MVGFVSGSDSVSMRMGSSVSGFESVVIAHLGVSRARVEYLGRRSAVWCEGDSGASQLPRRPGG